jgi:hypothetical protein
VAGTLNIAAEDADIVPAPEMPEDIAPALGDIAERHDGWTGQRMAMFCALLAETGIVSDACLAVDMSRTTAYQARRRNPLFAAAWQEALGLARNRLADELLERSLTGCVEKYYRHGELVGEKRVVDNKLGMAILRRLDRLSETGCALHSNLPATVRAERSRGTPAHAPDWDLMLSALRSGDEAMMAEAMIEVRSVEGDEACRADTPPHRPDPEAPFDDEEEGDEEPERCWWDEDEECWMTDFPPPPDSSGHQQGRWGKEDYRRECTSEESAALAAALDAALADERQADEAHRDAWFRTLRSGATESDTSTGTDRRQKC